MNRKQNKRKKATVKVRRRRRRRRNVGHIQWRKLDTDLEPPSVNDYLSSLQMIPKQYVDKLQEIVKVYNVKIMDSCAEVSTLGRVFGRLNQNVDKRVTLSPYGDQGSNSIELINVVATAVDLVERPIACLQVK